jgi:hypothetical protein
MGCYGAVPVGKTTKGKPIFMRTSNDDRKLRGLFAGRSCLTFTQRKRSKLTSCGKDRNKLNILVQDDLSNVPSYTTRAEAQDVNTTCEVVACGSFYFNVEDLLKHGMATMFVNTAYGGEPPNAKLVYSPTTKMVTLFLTRTIQPNEQIFSSYGPEVGAAVRKGARNKNSDDERVKKRCEEKQNPNSFGCNHLNVCKQCATILPKKSFYSEGSGLKGHATVCAKLREELLRKTE